MNIRTGQTMHEQIVSMDSSKNPVVPVSFDTCLYRDGVIHTGSTANATLVDSSRGVYNISWSADTTGVYQLYVKNQTTFSVFMSSHVFVKTDDEMNTNIYIGM